MRMSDFVVREAIIADVTASTKEGVIRELVESLRGAGQFKPGDTEDVVRSFRPEWTRATGNTVGLAFECSSPAEVDEVYARVVAAGFHGEKEPWDAFWGHRYAQLADPDGTPVDLFAAL